MDDYTTIREASGADHFSTARLLAEGQILGPQLNSSGRALT